MKRSRGSGNHRGRGRGRPTTLPLPPPPANMFEDKLNMEEMFGDIDLGQSTIPGSSDSNGDPITKPHFFRIIIDPSLHLRELLIPPAFIDSHGSTLLKHAFLRAPKGKEHKVKLMMDKDGTVLFTHGWKDFANCYSLAFGSWLVFRYEGSSRFHVFIFDTSCTEIEYPNFITGTIDEDEDEDGDDDEDWNEHEDDQGEDDINEAVKRAKAFKCDNPYFVSVMRPTYLTGDFRLWVPAKYAKEQQMMKEKNKKIFLQLEEKTRCRRTWKLNFTCETPCSPRLTTVRLTTGWKSFAINNDLKTGDACVFELIDHKTKMYKVHIFRKEA